MTAMILLTCVITTVLLSAAVWITQNKDCEKTKCKLSKYCDDQVMYNGYSGILKLKYISTVCLCVSASLFGIMAVLQIF